MKVVHVAVAAIIQSDQVLIAKRPEHVHQGGLWEFPGGKVEESESLDSALARELQEELGITPTQHEPLIQIRHDYGDKCVFLDVHKVTEFEGEPHGREGQPVEWVTIDALTNYTFPEANKPIIQALLLPDVYAITPEPADFSSLDRFMSEFEQLLANGISLLQLRSKKLDSETLSTLAKNCVDLAHQYDAKLVINQHADIATYVGADGLHLTSRQLRECTPEILGEFSLIAASCHNQEELQLAQNLGADFAVLSPVLATKSHPEATPIGWKAFEQLVSTVTLPCYALGGMGLAHISQAKRSGAQGVGLIRGVWPTRSEVAS